MLVQIIDAMMEEMDRDGEPWYEKLGVLINHRPYVGLYDRVRLSTSVTA